MKESNTKALPPCCSICTPHSPSHRPTATTNKPRNFSDISGRLETSFVNVPYSPPNAVIVNASRDSNRREWHGSEMYEVAKRVEGMLSAVEEIMMERDDSGEMRGTFYCKTCLDRCVVWIYDFLY
jgi:hypothetical protein